MQVWAFSFLFRVIVTFEEECMQGVSLGGRRRKSVGALSNVDRCQTACCLRPRPRLVRFPPARPHKEVSVGVDYLQLIVDT